MELKKLQTLGIIKPSEFTQWETLLVVVRKKNGEIRLCLDLKNTLNKVVDKMTYPLPKITDILNQLHGAKYYTVLHLRNTYYN